MSSLLRQFARKHNLEDQITSVFVGENGPFRLEIAFGNGYIFVKGGRLCWNYEGRPDSEARPVSNETLGLLDLK